MKTIDLRTPNLRDPEQCPIGTTVISTKGFLFKLIERTKDGKESWLDETAKLIWHDLAETNISHTKAMEKYKEKIPSREQFIEAEAHGFRDVLPHIKDHWWITSTQYPGNSDIAYVFVGANGVADYNYYRDFSNSYVAARCVSPAGQGAGVR